MENSVQARAWNAVLQRRDCDHLLWEILGQAALAPFSSEARPALTSDARFELACKFEVLFDTQRAHLSCWTLHESVDNGDGLYLSGREERSPYLLSLDVALAALRCYLDLYDQCQCQFTDERLANDSPKRRVLNRILLSGSRMLTLRPDRPDGSLGLAMAYASEARDERLLQEKCKDTWTRSLALDRNLYLPSLSGGQSLWPVDQTLLRNEFETRSQKCFGARNDSAEDHVAFWSLYDTVSSLLFASWQAQATDSKHISALSAYALNLLEALPNSAAQNSFSATQASELAILKELLWSAMPLQARKTRTDSLAEKHRSALDRSVEQDSERLAVLGSFIAMVDSRSKVLSDAEDLLLKNLVEQESSWLTSLDKRIRLALHRRETMSLSSSGREHHRIYAVNCSDGHIYGRKDVEIFLGDQAARLLPKLDYEGHARVQHACHFCSPGLAAVTVVREIRPFTAVMETMITQRQRIQDVRKSRQPASSESINPRVPSPAPTVVLGPPPTVPRPATTPDIPPMAPTLGVMPPAQRNSHEAPVLHTFSDPAPPSVPLGMAHTSPPPLSPTTSHVPYPTPYIRSQPSWPASICTETASSDSPVTVDHSVQGSTKPASQGSGGKSGMFSRFKKSHRATQPESQPNRVPTSSRTVNTPWLRSGSSQQSVALSKSCAFAAFWTQSQLTLQDLSSQAYTSIPCQGLLMVVASRIHCATVERYSSSGDIVRVFQYAGGQLMQAGQGLQTGHIVTSISLSGDEQYMAIAYKSGEVIISGMDGSNANTRWLFKTSRERQSLLQVEMISFSDSGESLIAVAFGDQKLHVASLKRPFQDAKQYFAYNASTFSTSGALAAISSSTDLTLTSIWSESETFNLRYLADTNWLKISTRKGSSQVKSNLYKAFFDAAGTNLIIVTQYGKIFHAPIQASGNAVFEELYSTNRTLRSIYNYMDTPTCQILDAELGSYQNVIYVLESHPDKITLTTIPFSAAGSPQTPEHPANFYGAPVKPVSTQAETENIYEMPSQMPQQPYYPPAQGHAHQSMPQLIPQHTQYTSSYQQLQPSGPLNLPYTSPTPAPSHQTPIPHGRYSFHPVPPNPGSHISNPSIQPSATPGAYPMGFRAGPIADTLQPGRVEDNAKYIIPPNASGPQPSPKQGATYAPYPPSGFLRH